MLNTLYQLIGWLVVVVASPFVGLYVAITGRHRQGLRQRFGYLDDVWLDEEKPTRIWLHAASVGEVQVARALITQIKQQLPEASVVVSTVTQQGFSVASSQLPSDVSCFFAPLDLCCIVNRAISTIRPTMYICLETELWPNIIRQSYENGITLLLLNGRISERSYAGYRKIKGFMERILSCFTKIAVIRADDAKRFRALGANPTRIRILGNAKYDLTTSQMTSSTGSELRRSLGLDNQPVLVTGSTHSGEEAMLLEVARSVQQRLPDLVWIVAPRHLQRLDEIETLFKEKGLHWERLSRIRERGRTAPVILVDAMGELAELYAVATYVFCGGSLVERGGHNILEPVAWGKPVFYGPSMKDFLDAKELLEATGAGFPVATPRDLATKLLYFIDRPEEYALAERRALRVSDQQQDSARQQVALIREVLHSMPLSGPTIENTKH